MIFKRIRKKLLKQLLAIPSRSGEERLIVEFLRGHCLEHGYRFSTDKHNNVYITNFHFDKSTLKYYPCVAAHLDTVQSPSTVKIVEKKGILTGLDVHGKQTGIGGDDKAGVFVCLELLRRCSPIKCVLFASEEVGCRGAYASDRRFFDDVGYVLEFDCPGRSLLSYTSGGERLFENQGNFIQRAMPVLQSNGITDWQRHPYTDVMAIRRLHTFSCLNLSCGYYNWHRQNEYVNISDVKNAVKNGAELIDVLGHERYECSNFDGESPVKLTHLNL